MPQIGREQSVAIHHGHRSLWVIKQRVRFSQSTAGPEKGRFPRKAKLYTGRTRRFKRGFDALGLRVGVGDDAAHTASRQMLHRECPERPIGNWDYRFGAEVGERMEARSEPGC
jgi:hypothetical protein